MDPIRFVPYDSTHYAKLIEFKKKKFNRADTQKYFDYRFINHPYIDDKSNVALVVYEGDDVIGEFSYLPMKFRAKGNTHCGVWGMDWMVDEKARGKGIGKEIAVTNLQVPNFFAFGTTQRSYDIQKKLGYGMLDGFIKLIYVPSVFSIIKLFIRGSKSKKELPKTVRLKDEIFEYCKSCPEMGQSYWNNDVIEPMRDIDFLKWRFFGAYNHFTFYYNTNKENPIYFVVKTLTWKNHKFIALVDFRVKRHDEGALNTIIKACKMLARRTQSVGVIGGSSLKEFTRSFKKNGFFPFENKDSAILTSSEFGEGYPFYKQEGIYITMADSDFENVYKLSGNLHRRVVKGWVKNAVKRFKFNDTKK